MDYTKQSPLTTISIGPGIRGIERGVERIVRLKHIAYVEIEAFIIENLVAEMEAGILDPAVIWSDAKTFPSHLFRGKVNLLLAGYPCQPFSNAGNRKGTEDPRHLWPHIERTIDIIRPAMCLFENVRGHVTLGLREVIESLEGLGYRVHWGIFSAEETGASHKRERVFIMAVRRDLANDYGEREPQSERLIKDIRGRVINESECMDNPSSHRSESDNQIPTGRNSAELASKIKLANTEHDGFNGAKNGESPIEGDNRNQTRQNTIIEPSGCSGEPCGYNEELGNASEQRFQESGQRGIWELQAEERKGVHDRFEQSSGNEVADSDNSRSGKNKQSAELRTERIEQSSSDCWRNNEGEEIERQKRSVARPGQPQHEWESPRVIAKIKSRFCKSVNGDKDGIDYLRLKERYAAYSNKKTRAIEELHSLWTTIEKEGLQWTFGGLFGFLKEKILFSEMYGNLQNQRLSIIGATPEKILSFKEGSLRDLWFKRIAEHPSQRQECFEQLNREFADAMCILSYQITLAGRQENEDSSYEQAVQNMWYCGKDSWWNVPQALSEIQKIWRPLSDQNNWERQSRCAYESYRLEIFDTKYGYSFREDFLRALGNSVYPDTAELAFRTLIKKF